MRLMRWSILSLACCLFLPAPASANDGAAPQVLSLPKGPGSLGGVGENVQANLNMGLMSYQIKLIVPKGRGDATPNPSITYSSSGGSSIVGIGWSFSAGSSIERATVRGLPTYSSDDMMYAGGELVKIPNSPFYRARYEGGFMRYQWIQQSSTDQRGYWIAESPDGSKMYYGANSKGELDLNAQIYGTKGTFRWELVTMVDRNGNRVEYSYFKDETQSYPDQIAWVFDDSNKPLYRLKFLYEGRSDHISDGKPGFDLKTTKRLKEIQITSNEKQFRRYTLDFEDATGLSRLIKVTRYGRDGKTAYPIQFKMKYSDAVFSKENSRMVTMSTALGVDFRAGNVDFVDINGDGLPDVVDTSQPKHVFHINQVTLKDDIKQDGHDFPKALLKENPLQTSAQLSNPSVQILDYNGDGFTDMVDAVNKKIYVNKGNAKWEDGSASLQNFPVTGKDPNMRFMDYDGDKKIDVISSDGSTTTFWVADGKGNWVVTPGKVNIGLGFDKDKLQLIDINGDGLQDVVHITKSSLRYRKYLGYGDWTDWITVNVPGIEKYELSTKAQFNDINGDGMADMVAFLGNKIVYFVNQNGESFAEGKELQAFDGIDIPDSTQTTIRIVDINGNGSRDIVWIDSSGKVVYLELFGKRPNLMTEISNNIGQRINVEYGSSVYFYLRDQVCKVGTDKACTGPWQNKMPMAFNVVTKIKTWASRTEQPDGQKEPTDDERPQIQSIFYHNGFYDGNEKKFRGFRHVETVYDGDASVEARKDEIKFDVGDQDPYFHGKMLAQTISDGVERSYRSTLSTWKDCPVTVGKMDGSTLDPPIRFICRTAQEETIIEGEQDKSKWRITRTEYKYDGFGNVILESQLGEKSKSGDELYQQQTFITPQDPSMPGSLWNIRSPIKVRNCDAPPDGNNNCAETEHYYDGEAFKGLSLGELRKGNITRLRIRMDRERWVTPMRRKYDKYGNLIAYIGLSGQVREIEWDDVYHRFAVLEKVKLKRVTLTATTQWDYALSKVVKSTDYNGHDLLYTFDVFGRLLTVANPEDSPDKPSIRHRYEVKAPLSRIITEKRAKAGGEYTFEKIQCFDGLGRKLSVRQRINGDRYLVANHREYNRLGMPARLWETYEGDDKCQFVAPSTAKSIQFFYDGLGRKTKTIYEDGGESHVEYRPFLIRRFDEADNDPKSPFYQTPLTLHFDGLGRTIQEVKIPAKGKSITTSYTYNSVNPSQSHLIQSVTFADGSTKRQFHDLLGNIIKVQDPDRSERTLEYNEQNFLIKRTDARGKSAVFEYDELGRTIQVQEEGKPETRITSVFDLPQAEFPEATNLKGKLAMLRYPGGTYFFAYDQKGQPKLERHVVLGVTFDIKREFDTDGRTISRLYPDGTKVTYQRDDAGRLLSIPNYLKSIAYHPNGTPQSWTAGNGIKTTSDFNARRWMTSLRAGDVFQLGYQYNANGQILSMAHQHGDKSYQDSYEFDAIYRLLEAKLEDGKETLQYTQDDIHNILTRNSSLGDKSPAHVGQYTYDPKKIHAATQTGKVKLKYDAAGYVEQRDKRSFSWDYLGRMSEVKEGEKSVARYWYGSSRRRLIKEEAGHHVFYIDDLFQIRDGVGLAHIKFGLDRVVSIRSARVSAVFFDDVADGKADGKITSADAWVYHATRSGLAKASLKKRPIDLDLTKDMLRASAFRLLHGDEPVVQYHHVDHLGNVLAVTDQKGAVVSRTAYYPYGAIRSQQGPMPVYTFMGAEYEPITHTYRFLKRTMDTRLGRWLSPDPAFDQINGLDDEYNSYGLGMNNPISLREFQGTRSIVTAKRAFYALAGIGAALGAMEYSHSTVSQGISEAKTLLTSDVGKLATDIAIVATSAVMMGASLMSNDSVPVKEGGSKWSGRLSVASRVSMAASWAMFGTARALRTTNPPQEVTVGLNLAMAGFWALSEKMKALSLKAEQSKASIYSGFGSKKKRFGRVGARIASALAVAGGAALSFSNDPILQTVGTGLIGGASILGSVLSRREARQRKKASSRSRIPSRKRR